MADLPANVSYGTVTGKFIKAIGDTADALFLPDAVPASGTVTFDPAPARLVDAGGAPAVTIFLSTISCTLDAAGVLVSPGGGTGVTLVATDDPDLNPTGWTYGVSIAITGEDVITFSMAVPGGSTVDLSTLVPLASTGGLTTVLIPVSIVVALSDETTTITTGNAKATMRAPYAFTLTGVRASVNTVSTSGLVTVDINQNAATILSTKLTIDANEKTSTTAATPAVMSATAIADDAELTFDIDVAGTGAKGLKVAMIGQRPVS
jgi:hypothetical protein